MGRRLAETLAKDSRFAGKTLVINVTYRIAKGLTFAPASLCSRQPVRQLNRPNHRPRASNGLSGAAQKLAVPNLRFHALLASRLLRQGSRRRPGCRLSQTLARPGTGP